MILPVFYFKQMVLVMSPPSEYIKHKIALKEHLNQELNPDEKKFIRENIQEIQKLKAIDRKQEKQKKFEKEKHLHLMYKKKVAKGPNPLSVKKANRDAEADEAEEHEDDGKKKRRKRAGRRRRDDKEDRKNAENAADHVGS
uniref:UTP23 sensor motif region domain-containing protein n=1 Tax=Euplotes harpa TaxID=151035 RepID=A0A7S3NAA0_9SPIT|mmetsp:Transcript_29526/g.33841  ORF Transcript_29526/g.33841 Transcript_29526/m.33841 type:complete len:141 (+) Transcript_29526:385-807(+)